MTGVFFVAAAVGEIGDLQAERYELFKAGLSPVDWLRLTKWQRQDLLARHRMEIRVRANIIKQNKLQGLISVLVSKILGM